MAELIDLIIYMLRNEENQQLSMHYAFDMWFVAAVPIDDEDTKYKTESKTLIDALNKLVIILDERTNQ